MKRDLDIVRSVLLTAEAADRPVDESALLGCCGDMRRLAFHVELMHGRGLVDAAVSYDGFGEQPLSVEVRSVTWEGYDYLDAIRSPKVWARAKAVISEAVGDTSLSVVKEVCTMIAIGMAKASLGL